MYFSTSGGNPQQHYKLLTGGVVPRPIAWVSTISPEGVANLAPYSFFTVASVNPPVLCVVQVTPRNRSKKDTLFNLENGSDCVVNVVSHELAQVMNQTCGDYSPAVSEFEAAGVQQTPSTAVKAPGVAQAKMRYECTLREVKVVADNPMGGQMMLLDVQGVYVADDSLEGDTINPIVLDAVGKTGGDGYATTRERFELERPNVTTTG